MLKRLFENISKKTYNYIMFGCILSMIISAIIFNLGGLYSVIGIWLAILTCIAVVISYFMYIFHNKEMKKEIEDD